MFGGKLRSDNIKKGVNRLPHRSLFKSLGFTDEEIARPIIGVVNSANTLIPYFYFFNLLDSFYINFSIKL